MIKNSRILTFLMITAMLLLFMGGEPVSANISGAEKTREFSYTINYVKPGGNGDCLSWETACELQTALSNIPDQVWVATGVYKPTTTGDRAVSFELESGVRIFGGFPAAGGAWETRDWQANPTTLSGDIGIEGEAADNSYHVVTADGVNKLGILDGFTITGGNANALEDEPNSSGGGMYNLNSNPTLSNLIIIGNTAKNGAGMFNDYSNPALTNVIITGNVLAEGGTGAGMSNINQSSPTLSDVTFLDNGNFYEGGGAMLNVGQSSPTLTNVDFIDNLGGGMINQDNSNPTLTNVIFSGNSSLIGGGMSNVQSSPTLTNVTFSGNTGSRGGGMYNNLSNPILTNVTFLGNSVSDYPTYSIIGIGGGIANYYGSSPSLTNVTFSENTASAYGGGLYNAQNCFPTLKNVTFWGNTAGSSGGGIAFIGNYPPTLTNTILWGNTPDQIYTDQVGIFGDVTYSVIQGDGVYPGEGNINTDPLLLPLADNGGFTQTHALGSGSSAIDAGNPENYPATDQRGVARPQGEGCDIGAYEYEGEGYSVYLPLILK